MALTPEEKDWVKAAAAADEGRGIPLAAVDLNDMEDVYSALKVTGLAKIRLRAYIKRLQETQQPNGKLRCCFCILVFKCCFECGNTVMAYSVFNLGVGWCSDIPPSLRCCMNWNMGRRIAVGELSNYALAAFNNDITVSWEANQSKAVQSLPSTNDLLEEFIKSPPAERARIEAKVLNEWKGLVPEHTLNLYFVGVSTGDACLKLGRILTNLLFEPPIIPGTNEDSYHGRIDQCLLTFLKRFTRGLELRRNTSGDASSTLLKRPDMIACVPGKGCYFRGEEKRIDSNEDPKSELHSKLENIWPFPGLAYVLGYHSTGCFLTFSKILVGSAVNVAGPLNLDDPTSRLQCWNTTRNISRLLNFMVTAPGPSRMPNDMEDLENGGGSGLDWRRTIRFSGGHVVKECIVDTADLIQKQQRLESVLSILQHGLEGVQPIVGHKKSSGKRQRSDKFYLETTLGETIARVESTAQLRSLVEFLLKTVRRLHNKGITHRDLRLPNIVKSITDGEFALIDWDDSVMGIQNLDNAEVAHLDATSHATETFVPLGQHDSSVDLWSIGYFIRSSLEYADPQLLTLMNRLLAPANERLSDNEACRLLGIEETE